MGTTDTRDTRQVFIPDPRPQTVQKGGDYLIDGMQCRKCGHASAQRVPWCPRCHGEMAEHHFGPAGTVWSSTVVHIPLPGRQPPYALAYVDLDNGPRVLAHVNEADDRLAIGSTVQLIAPTENGDVQVKSS